jgi:dihydrofolate reductase
MRNLAVQMYVSMDGGAEAPEKWSSPYWTDDCEKYAYGRLLAADALLIGRNTYMGFAAAWPLRKNDPFADRMNSIVKYVASSTMQDDDLEWNNSHVVSGDVVDAVRKLKAQPGDDILLYGSRQLFNTVVDAGLVDDLRLWVHPIVLGQSPRLFDAGLGTSKFELVDTTTFSTGIAVLSYQPASDERPRS